MGRVNQTSEREAMTSAKVRVRLSAQDALEDCVDALKELVRSGSGRERYLAAVKLIEWATEDSETEITLCAVAPEVISLDAIRAEAERRRQLALRGDNQTLSDISRSTLVDMLEKLEPPSEPD